MVCCIDSFHSLKFVGTLARINQAATAMKLYSFSLLLIVLFSSNLSIADPGESTSISVCVQHSAFNLIDALQGTPLGGGTWLDPDENIVMDGVFDPATSMAGTYTYTVDAGQGPESATVEIELINCAGSPANNDCGSAQFINPANGIPFSTLGATTDGLPHFGEENCEINGEAQIENDVWYLYVASCDGNATVSTVGGTSLDTKIAAYTFSCPPSTDLLLACSDNFGSSYQSSMTFEVEQNGIYLIRIGESPGPGSGNGTFNLNEVCFGEEPPENELCSAAIAISPNPAISFSTTNATTDGPDHAGDGTCSFFGDALIHNDVWFTYTASCDGQASLSTLGGTTLDTRVAVYLDVCPEDLSTLLVCNDDFQGFAQSSVTWDVTQGEQYTIRIGNSSFSSGGSGTFSLEEICGQDAPPNDNCANAQVISPAFGIAFNSFNATTDGPSHFNNPVCTFFGGSQIERDLWYQYTASCDGIAEVSTVDGTFLDTRLAVYAESCPDNSLFNLVVCNDDDNSQQSTVNWTVVEGDTYYIRLGEFPGAGGGSGTFNLVETCMEICAPPVIGYQASCSGLDDFEGFFVTAVVSTFGNAAPYTMTASLGGEEQIITGPGVYEFGPFQNDESVFFDVVSLDDPTCSSTSYLLSRDCYPDNLNFTCIDSDQIFENVYFSYTAENALSEDNFSELSCNFDEIYNELWYFYTAPCTGEATWTNCALSDVPTRMMVYDNTCENEDLELLACSTPDACNELASSVTFDTFQGVTYVLRLGSTTVNDNATGVFRMEQEIELVSAGADTTLAFCTEFNGNIVLNNFLQQADAGGTWTDDDNTGALVGNTLFFNSLDTPGEFHFSYEVQGPCNTDVSTITVIYDVCDNVLEHDRAIGYKIFPNPGRGAFRVVAHEVTGLVQLSIFDISGRSVAQQSLQFSTGSQLNIDLEGILKAGVYLVQFIHEETGHRETIKLIVQ